MQVQSFRHVVEIESASRHTESKAKLQKSDLPLFQASEHQVFTSPRKTNSRQFPVHASCTRI